MAGQGQKNINEVVRVDLFTDLPELQKKYSPAVSDRIVRLRDMYNWILENPSLPDREFVAVDMGRYGLKKTMAYSDLQVLKLLLPEFHKTARDYARWKYNEMILETYKMAKSRKDTKSMERAASSYAKFNKVDVDENTEMPFDLIVVQPFTATDDPSVLGIKRTPNIRERIKTLIDKYRQESIDIEDVEYEEADLEEEELFDKYEIVNEEDDDDEEGREEDLLQ